MQGHGHNIELGNDPGELGGTLPFVNLGTDFRVRQLAVGQRHVCALGANGSVKCWGENYQGELGLGDNSDRGSGPGQMGDNLPALDLGTDFDVVALECGDISSCARSSDGRLKCWGNNGVGTLGLGDLDNRGDQMGEMGDALDTADVGAGLVALDVSVADAHVCALFTSGGIKCWGWGLYGQLGLGNTEDRGGTPESLGAALPFVVVE
jgi:alpha-tubulin suppressor-like RCC1 family protein